MPVSTVMLDPGFNGGPTSSPKPDTEVTAWARAFGVKWTQVVDGIGLPRNPNMPQADWATLVAGSAQVGTAIATEYFQITDPSTGKVVDVRVRWMLTRNTYPSVYTYALAPFVSVGYDIQSDASFLGGSTWMNWSVSNNASMTLAGRTVSGVYRAEEGYLAFVFDEPTTAPHPLAGSVVVECWKNDGGAAVTAGDEGVVMVGSGFFGSNNMSSKASWVTASSGVVNALDARGPFVMPVGVTSSASVENLYLGKALVLGNGKPRTLSNAIGYFNPDLPANELYTLPLPTGAGVGLFKALGIKKSMASDYVGVASSLIRWE